MIEADTIDRLVRLKPNGLPVLSMYVNIDPVDHMANDMAVHSLLDRIRPLAHDESLDREARLSVREDIEQIELAARRERWNPGSIGIFSSSRQGVFEEVALPRLVHEQVVVDATPFVRPMLAVLDEYHRACVVLISKGSARAWELYQNEMREATAFHDLTLRKPNYAVWRAENRIHHRKDELAKRHYRRTVDVLEQMFRSGGYDLLVVAGREHEIPAFVEFLPYELGLRLAGSFAIDDSALLGDIKAEAQAVLDRYERDEETRMVAEVLDRAAMGGLATTGLTDCLWAGSVSAVQLLLVQEAAALPGVVCDESGLLALSGDICPESGNPTRPVPDIIDELVTRVVDDGGAIEHVQAETALTDHVVAARLRFPLPPRP
jgi:hypothetical protein